MKARNLGSANQLRISLLGLTLVGIAVLALVVHVTGRPAKAEEVEARDAFVADLQAGKLSTRDAFEARCRAAQRSEQTKTGTELHYTFANIYVTFGPLGPPILESESTYSGADRRVQSYRRAAAPGLVFDLLGCE